MAGNLINVVFAAFEKTLWLVVRTYRGFVADYYFYHASARTRQPG